MRSLPHIFGRVFNTPLAVTVERIEPLIAGLRAASFARGIRLNGEKEDDEDRYPTPPREQFDGGEEEWEEDRHAGYMISAGGIARIGISDVLCRRAGQVQADSTELDSYMKIGGMARLCMADERVRGVILDIDSPGGESGGLFELCRDLRAMSAIKPIWAVANEDALSAAYAIASACDRVWITSTGSVGSVGVIAMHTDQSGFDEEKGMKYSYIFAGARKADYNPHAPLSAIARANLQSEVDRLYGLFVGMVASYRGLKPSAVAATEAATIHGPLAVALGLADRVGTFGQAVAAMTEAYGGYDMTTADLSGVPALQPGVSSPAVVTLEAEPVAEPTPAAPVPLATELNAVQDQIAAAIPPAAVRNVVRLDQVRQATNAVRRDAAEIVSLCAMAGMADLATQYIENETPISAVRSDLIRRQAEIASAAHVTAVDVSAQVTTTQSTQQSELSKIVNERFAAQAGRKGM
jgi:capsid assembly protease